MKEPRSQDGQIELQSQRCRGRSLTAGLTPAWPASAPQRDPTHHKQKIHRKKGKSLELLGACVQTLSGYSWTMDSDQGLWFRILLPTFYYICLCVHTCASRYAQDSLHELALCSDHTGPKDLTQFLGLGSRHP